MNNYETVFIVTLVLSRISRCRRSLTIPGSIITENAVRS